ncbi:MAG: hypothetical protein CMH22_05695 [Methylophaga sp.]|nr:hypothetical protein [Methylophaga sp.]
MDDFLDEYKAIEYIPNNEVFKGMYPVNYEKETVKQMLKDLLELAADNAKVKTEETKKEVFIGWGAGRTPTYDRKTLYSVDKESILNILKDE